MQDAFAGRRTAGVPALGVTGAAGAENSADRVSSLSRVQQHVEMRLAAVGADHANLMGDLGAQRNRPPPAPSGSSAPSTYTPRADGADRIRVPVVMGAPAAGCAWLGSATATATAGSVASDGVALTTLTSPGTTFTVCASGVNAGVPLAARIDQLRSPAVIPFNLSG